MPPAGQAQPVQVGGSTSPAFLGGDSKPSIGRPIGETRVVLLDRFGGRVPPGAPGELCIGGAGVVRGYLGRPELTAERFVVDAQGARIYRSGDRARWRGDGRLEFLGRIDEQVKVRGFRVEPGEVEARLLAHPRVRQVAVAAAGDRLAGYVVAEGVSGEELAAFAGEALPGYMVPSVWVWLAELPLTRHGKVDRGALPYPEMEAGGGSVAPRTDAEQLVAEVYGEVLGIAEVGALDDFFAVGGHSLLAARVIARIRSITGIDVPIRTMFDGATVAALAAAVEALLVEELEELSDEEAARLAGSVRSQP
ncbi:phosphopantetheine-binding protein [Acrocarpospora phusangensis]|uniref:phosphopantetheine-binding protein n=1 Tax=Acrocarpospora phusangensis TaxID=1070424 RepID=UPI0023B21ED7|nr:phosphopantetheine-binding protein [Acrocarpospora phusangensis]